MYRVWGFLSEYSLLLILGALLGLTWANLDPGSYHAFVEVPLIEGGPIGHLHVDAEGHAHRTLTLHYLINDMLMALFFAIAGKEVWEAVALQNGALRGRRAVTPLIATAGGMIGPAAVYLGGAAALGSFAALAHGWAIPTATDIAFSYLVGRMVFGAGHPAVMFLLLLAIADDAGGLIILAVFYPQGELAPAWLLLSFGAAATAYLLFNWLPRPHGPRRSAQAPFEPRPPQARLLAVYRRRVPELVRLPAGGHPSGARPPAGHPGDPAFGHRIRPLRRRGGASAGPAQPHRARPEGARSR